MMHHRAAPGVQHRRDADAGAKPLLIGEHLGDDPGPNRYRLGDFASAIELINLLLQGASAGQWIAGEGFDDGAGHCLFLVVAVRG